MVLGVSSNLTRPAQGFGKPQQAAMVRELQRLVQGLRQAGVLLWHCVIPAKVRRTGEFDGWAEGAGGRIGLVFMSCHVFVCISLCLCMSLV